MCERACVFVGIVQFGGFTLDVLVCVLSLLLLLGRCSFVSVARVVFLLICCVCYVRS